MPAPLLGAGKSVLSRVGAIPHRLEFIFWLAGQGVGVRAISLQ